MNIINVGGYMTLYTIMSALGMEFDAIWQAILFILGGLGIFLFGIHMMGSSLK